MVTRTKKKNTRK